MGQLDIISGLLETAGHLGQLDLTLGQLNLALDLVLGPLDIDFGPTGHRLGPAGLREPWLSWTKGLSLRPAGQGLSLVPAGLRDLALGRLDLGT